MSKKLKNNKYEKLKSLSEAGALSEDKRKTYLERNKEKTISDALYDSKLKTTTLKVYCFLVDLDSKGINWNLCYKNDLAEFIGMQSENFMRRLTELTELNYLIKV